MTLTTADLRYATGAGAAAVVAAVAASYDPLLGLAALAAVPAVLLALRVPAASPAILLLAAVPMMRPLLGIRSYLFAIYFAVAALASLYPVPGWALGAPDEYASDRQS